jgi:hypothetical protein
MESVEIEADSEPGRVARELEVAGEIRELFYLCGEHSRFRHVLLAAADTTVWFDEETAATRP